MTLGACSGLGLRNGYFYVSGMFPSVSEAKIRAAIHSHFFLKNFFFSHLFFTTDSGLSTAIRPPGVIYNLPEKAGKTPGKLAQAVHKKLRERAYFNPPGAIKPGAGSYFHNYPPERLLLTC